MSHETNSYYVVERDGDKVELRYEVWQTVYGDCLINTQVVKTGTSAEIQEYLQEQDIDEVIARGI